MLKRCLAFLMILLLAVTAALAEDDGLVPYSDDALLDMMAEIPEEGDEDNSGFLVLPESITMPEEDVFTILLIGADAYTDSARGRSDTIIYVQVDAAGKTIRMASFLRDMYVEIPGKGSNRINASYSWGGEKLLRRTLEHNFGLTADAYVAVNFERLVKVIDALGGVEVEVSQREQVQVNSILRFYNVKIGAPEDDQLLTEHGLVNLTGKQALCFSRIRKIDGDVQRTARQRKVLEAAFRKAASLSLADLTAVALGNLDAVQTDLTVPQIMTLIPMAKRCRNATFESIRIPVEGSYSSRMIDGMYVVVPNLRKNRQALAAFFIPEE